MSAAGSVHPIGFGDLLAAELGKIRTLPSTWVALAVAVATDTALGILAAIDAVRIAGPDGPIPLTRLGTLMLAPVYAVVAIAVLAADSEYRTGQLRISLAAVPARDRLAAAKLTAVAAVALLAAIPAALPGHLAQHTAELGGTRGIGAAGVDLAALLAAHLLLSLIGFGFAVVTRNAVTPLAVLVGTPVLVSPALQGTLPDLVRLFPHEATLGLLDRAADPAALDRTGGLFVLLAWATLFVGSAWAVLTRRDC